MNGYAELNSVLSPEWERSGFGFHRMRSNREWASISAFSDPLDPFKPEIQVIFVQAFSADCPPDPAKEAAYQAEFGEPQRPGRGLVEQFRVAAPDEIETIHNAARRAEELWAIVVAGKLIDTIVSMREPDPATSGAASA